MEKKKVTYEETMPLERAVDYLQGLVDELKEGGFTIISDEGPLSFRPLEDVELEVELEQKKGKQELEIELSWKSEDYEEEEEEESEEEEEEDEEDEEAAAEAAGEGEEESSKECPVAKALPFAVLAVLTFVVGLVVGRIAGKGRQGKAGEESGVGVRTGTARER